MGLWKRKVAHINKTMATDRESDSELDTASEAGWYSETSVDSDEFNLRDLQKFVLQRGNKIYLKEPFFLEVRKRKSKIFGRKRGVKYIKRLVYDLKDVKGELIPAPQTKEIHFDGGIYVPLEVAEAKVDATKVAEEDRRFQAVVNSLLKPVTLHIYDEEKEEYNDRIDKEEGMEDPKEGDPEIYVNIPEPDMLKGPPKPNAFMLSTWRGRPIFVAPSGQVFAFGPFLRRDKVGIFQGWHHSKIEEMSLEVAERAKEMQERMDREEVADLRSRCAMLEEKVQELEEARAGDEIGGDARPYDELADFNLVDKRQNLITNVQKAVNLPAVLKSIGQWGRDSDVSAEDWLRASVEMAKSAGVAVAIIHEVLIMRLRPRESGEMWALRNSGEVHDTNSFLLQFKRKFWQPITALQKLRIIQNAHMTESQLREMRFNDFGNGLRTKAHEAYTELGIPNSSWEDVDRVMVTLAFLSGIPKDLAFELMTKRLGTLEQHMDEAVFLSTCGKNAGKPLNGGGGGPLNVGYVSAGGGAAGGHAQAPGGRGGQAPSYGGGAQGHGGQGHGGQGQGGQGQSGHGQGGSGGRRRRPNKKDFVCSKCRALPNPPERCDHCRKCGEEGHMQYDCPLGRGGARGDASGAAGAPRGNKE